MNTIGKYGVHHNLVNGPANQQAAAARYTPFLNAPHRGQGQGHQAVMPTNHHLVLAPMFYPATVPRLPDTAVPAELLLNDSIQVTGNHLTAQVQG